MARWIRFGFCVAVVLVLAYCLIGIVLTGPIVVRPPKLEFEVGVSPERMQQTVRLLCSDFAPRDYRHPENLDRAADWIAERFREMGLQVSFQDYEIHEGRFRNVVAYRPGTDPGLGVIVVGAHYDAYGGFPGADDNASGVAVLLELARTPPQPVTRAGRYFVAFSTEEPPFFGSDSMGSYVFAKSLVDQDIQVELMIALDAVGYYTDKPDSQHFPVPLFAPLYPDRGNFIAILGDLRSGKAIWRVKQRMVATKAIPVHSFRAPSTFGVDQSDHLWFRKLGMPGVMVTDTAYMRGDHYHTSRDTPDLLDYERMGRLVHALHGVLWDLELD